MQGVSINPIQFIIVIWLLIPICVIFAVIAYMGIGKIFNFVRPNNRYRR